MQLPGITMRVVGQDASLLRDNGDDLSYDTDTLYIGPGEARDVLFDAPPYDNRRPSGSDSSAATTSTTSRTGTGGVCPTWAPPVTGGMMTEVRVYPLGTLDPQTVVSQTYV